MKQRVTMTTAVPLTPRKRRDEDVNLKINAVISSLSHEWDLQLELPRPGESPGNRLHQSLAQKCVFTIKALTFKSAIDSVLEDFDSQANILYSRWVYKPKGDRGTVPERTRHKPHPVSDKERVELQTLFHGIASREFNQIMAQERGTPLSKRRVLRSDDENIAIVPSTSPLGFQIDDTPIPSKLPSSARKTSLKRAAEATDDESKAFKRPPQPGSKLDPDVMSEISFLSGAGERNLTRDSSTIRSVSTSFASHAPSVFDTSFTRSRGLFDTLSLSQTTEPDDQNSEFHFDRSTKLSIFENHHSSEYEGGSSFDAELVKVADSFHSVNDQLQSVSIPAEIDEDVYEDVYEDAIETILDYDEVRARLKKDKLRESLKGIFPILPDCLLYTPLHVRYEIMRVFIHARVSLDTLVLPDNPRWDDYDWLWKFFQKLPVLANGPFPERSSKQAWAACQDNFQRGPRGVAMSGSLRYHHSASTGPLFRFQLEPLRLEQTYRLRRRFGNDRFLELDMPSLTGRRVPKVLRDCPNGKAVVIDWLVEDMHPNFGRLWVPFCTRPKEGKERKAEMIEQSEMDTGVAHRIYFFAVHGFGFNDNRGTPEESETVETRTAMTVEALLNWTRPTWENREESYLKLFARTPLALSRNTATVVLDRKQIRYNQDLKCNGEVMTDGAGRLSASLALKSVGILGLSHLPSGFQGRIGDAKGLWSIDPTDHGVDKWIEIYDSQRKWKRSGKTLDDYDCEDPAHRTFEVNKWSGKLKSADLNLQLLPILIDRAEDKLAMHEAIEELLKTDLKERIQSQRAAMENPLQFRKWVREANPRLGDRVKHGVVPCLAAMPESTEEKLNMFLDAGFDPLTLKFLFRLSQKYFTQKCEDLKKQHRITIPRSTYAFMVPDFAGVLEPDEIYIHMSESFVDELSPMSGCPLQGMDVLVARSPAHFASDIQRVKAVVKGELLGLKDVVVFPIKGNPSLADKLSGGDYDGDLAWICWEPSIVKNFVNAEVPQLPDLVNEGFILKDRTTYEDLTKGEKDPTKTFLKKSFEFNLENSMLGICTVFKEHLCYTHDQGINSEEAIYLSTLLSNLVDHAKQGYTFTEVQWNRFRAAVIKTVPRQPRYKSRDLSPKAEHIIDRIAYVADTTIEEILQEFHESNAEPKYWDPDLVLYFEWAQKEALVDAEWLEILSGLKTNICLVAAEWKRLVPQEGSKADEPFTSAVTKCYGRFQAIRPVNSTPLTRSLLEGWHQSPEVSRWALLRASCAFAIWSKSYVSTFVWWMAGMELCLLKAMKSGGVVSMTRPMYAMLKPDNTFVKLRYPEEAANQLKDKSSEAGRVERGAICEALADDKLGGSGMGRPSY